MARYIDAADSRSKRFWLRRTAPTDQRVAQRMFPIREAVTCPFILSAGQAASQLGVRAKAVLSPESNMSEVPKVPTVLLTGASRYVGGRLIPHFEQQSVVLRCLALNPDKLRPLVKTSMEIVRGDVLDAPALDKAL